MKSLGFVGCLASAATAQVCCCAAEAAADATYTDEHGHVPTTFYFRKQAGDSIELVGHSLPASGVDPRNSCSLSQTLVMLCSGVEHLTIIVLFISSLSNPVLILIDVSAEAFCISTNYKHWHSCFLCWVFVPFDQLHPLFLPSHTVALCLALFAII